MSLVSRLPFPPQPDESLRGLFLRVAEDNLCTGEEFKTWLGVRSRNPCTEQVAASVAGKLGMEVEAFMAMGFIGDGETARHPNLAPKSEWAPLTRMRWCPACLAEKPYHRRAWNWTFLRVCPVHRLKLRSSCAQCEANGLSAPYTGWHRTGLTACFAGHSLLDQPTEAIPDCSGAAAIYRLLGLRCDGPDLPEEFLSRPHEQTIQFVLSLGFLEYVVAKGDDSKSANVVCSKDYRLLEAGVRVARGWPVSFDRLAGAVRLAYGSQRPLLRQYGKLYSLAARGAPTSYLPMVREAFAAHLLRRPDGPGETWPGFLPLLSDRDETLNQQESRRLLGLSTRSFNRLTRTAVWKDMPALNSGEFRRSDVFALKHRLSRFIDIYGTPSVLGTSSLTETEDFCRAASITPILWAPKGANRARNRSLALDEIEHALTQVREAGRTSPPECPINWRAVARRASFRRVIYNSKLFAALLSGRLQAYVAYPERNGLEAFTFEEADVAKVLDELALPDVSGYMTLDDAFRHLGRPEGVIKALMAAKRFPETTGAERTLVATADVRRFEDIYVCDRELAADTGATPACVRETLSMIGVDPEVEVDLPGEGVWAVYRRAKVDQSWERLEALLAADRKAISAEA